MADEIKLPEPDAKSPLTGNEYFYPGTVRRLIAEHVAAAVAAERERCAALCEQARPAGGRAWDEAQAACHEALSHVADAMRDGLVLPADAQADAREDTRRLDWLDDHGEAVTWIDDHAFWDYAGCQPGRGAIHLRDAIDAAMQAERGEPEHG